MSSVKVATFINAQAMALAHPESFQVPGKADLAAIKPGGFIKVCAERDGRGERFWIKVKAIRPSQDGTRYTGEVDNNLLFTEFHGLAYGDTVEVADYEIYAVG